MSWINKYLLFMVLLVGGLAGWRLDSADKKSKSDRHRIEQLEQDVQVLKTDLAGEHTWAMDVNDGMGVLDQRTLDLHSRVSRLENRGPVANYSPQDPR